MAKEEQKTEQDGQEGQPKKGGMIKWIIIGVVAVVLIGGGAAAFFMMKGAEKKEPVKEQPVPGVWPMEPFIVNLADNNGERYLKVTIELEVTDKKIIEELNILKPKLRDNVLDLLTAKSYKDLVDMVGKQRLRDEIQMRLNSYLSGGKITKVYFTEFVIQ